MVVPRLCSSDGLPIDTKYVTLSHHWSDTDVVTLTRANDQLWRHKFSVSKLSPLFKDAMEAAKCLGVRYIWIDCLCIIQDSEEDWLREAKAMADVYHSSYCNLTAATNNSHLFANRDPMDVQARVVRPQKKGWRPEQYLRLDPDMWNYLESSPLFTRAWVLQERALAPRNLHFTSQQIFWECQELHACESLPVGMPGPQWKLCADIETLDGKIKDFISFRQPDASRSSKWLALWYTVVAKYTAGDLTFPEKDKLTALSGLAKSMNIDAEYLAGMWGVHLAFQLLWWSEGRRLGKHLAPSLSWASRHGVVDVSWITLEASEEIVLEVVNAYTKKATSNPTGQVRAGFLRLRGCLASIDHHSLETIQSYRISYQWDGAKDDPELNVAEGGTFCFLPVKLKFGEKGIRLTAFGLLLEPTTRRNGEFYKRGVFRLVEEGTSQSFVSLFDRSIARPKREHYECVAERVDPVYKLPMYEITVI